MKRRELRFSLNFSIIIIVIIIIIIIIIIIVIVIIIVIFVSRLCMQFYASIILFFLFLGFRFFLGQHSTYLTSSFQE